jgi:hypothetical protein
MKPFFKSAMFLNLLITIGFIILTALSYYNNAYVNGSSCPTMFFGACAGVFAMLLPSCSTTN